MSDRVRSFKQCDLTRALKGIAKAGQAVRNVRITPDGEIAIELDGHVTAESENEWDQVLKK